MRNFRFEVVALPANSGGRWLVAAKFPEAIGTRVRRVRNLLLYTLCDFISKGGCSAWEEGAIASTCVLAQEGGCSA